MRLFHDGLFFSKDVSVKAVCPNDCSIYLYNNYGCRGSASERFRRVGRRQGRAARVMKWWAPGLARTERHASSSLREHLYGSGETGTGTGDRYRRWRRVGRVTKGNVSKSVTAGWVAGHDGFLFAWVGLGWVYDIWKGRMGCRSVVSFGLVLLGDGQVTWLRGCVWFRWQKPSQEISDSMMTAL